jgi:hypothetical protein
VNVDLSSDSPVITVTHDDGLWSETFAHREGPHGFIQLGYKAVSFEGGWGPFDGNAPEGWQ